MKMGVEITQSQEIACQELLKSTEHFYGWLRQKTRLHKLSDALDRKLNGNNFQAISTLFSWEKRFIILKEGHAYFYNSETAKRASKVIDLAAFKSVDKVDILKARDVAWPFKLVSFLTDKDLFLSATSLVDQQNWMTALEKGIKEAEASGRRRALEEVAMSKRSVSHPAGSDDDASDDDYDEIPNIAEDEEEGAEYEIPSVLQPNRGKTLPSRRERAVPPVPVEKSSDDASHSKTQPKPPPAKKPIAAQKSVHSLPRPNEKKLLPAVPQKKQSSKRDEDDDEVEYELEEDLFTEALWTGDADEGIQLMRNLREDGVFMIRQSTSGNGDQTLQVIVRDELKKYKLSSEGGKYRMAGGQSFNDVIELLKFYQMNNIPNYETKLTKPYKQTVKH